MSIFSAPNYCYRCGNEAAVIEIEDENNFNCKTYSAAPKEVYKRRRGGKERRDSADIDGDGDYEEEEEDKSSENKDNKDQNEDDIEKRINQVNEDYFHLKYELRYFV